MKELTINSLCRVCLKNSNFYSNIYKDRSIGELLVYELLNDVCVLGISVDDGLPAFLCGDCFKLMVEFKSFKANAQNGKSALLHLKERMENFVMKQEKLHIPGDVFEEPFPEPVLKQEEFDIPGDDFEEPFPELDFRPIILKEEMLTVYGDRHGQEDLNDSEACVSVNAVEASAASNEDSTQDQFTDFGTVTHPHHLDCLEDKRPHCRFNGAVIADACTMDISIDENSIFEKSRIISLGVEVEAEIFEGQGIHPGESMCMTSPLEVDMSITKEESRGEVRKTGAEGGRGSVEKEIIEGERESFKCYHCGNELMTKRGLVKHMELHRFGNSYKCETCGKIFQNNSKFISPGSNQFNCVECSKIVSQNSIHKRQMRSHMGSKPYTCEKCSKTLSCSSQLIIHMRSHTGSKPYKCLECSKCFSHRSNLVMHMRSHTGSKPYKCFECSKYFNQRSNLLTHMRLHSGSKPYKCLECSKYFSQKSNLVMHMTTHTGSKPYKCVECSKCFGRNFHLIRHMKLHARSKQYPCMECSKWFSQTSHLTAHMKCHMGTFKCAICSKGFTDKFLLKRHLFVHTKEKCHECHNCRMRFSQRTDLKIHIERNCKGITK